MGRGDTPVDDNRSRINDDVFIESFYDFYGVDNASYTLTLSKRRSLQSTLCKVRLHLA